ncbi:tyrosine-type recombinase/integrase [Mesorhizobium sp. B2-5-11]|uniref:tyrosine-type recombinase/integrase n=1 Tax=Mesorhizobium sp. B2-5-11 TaxID=2589919 RepID=UPI00112EE9B1|nr:tyrosine-type recombinase/integrase [Mesorhizobium sp. B2-5-11]TPK14113.1 site-specific integrase [Mesorhizobium sp. B2-5-11]
MPRARKPPRLWLRTEKDGDKQRSTWVILDGSTHHRTGCLAHQVAEAGQALNDYLASKYEAPKGGRASEITLGAVLTVYLDEKSAASARPKETQQTIGRLNDFFGAKTVSEVKGKLCREFETHRGTRSGARRDLEVMRAAVRHYHKEYGLDVVPAFTLPDKGTPREVYLTRSQAAELLWAALGWEKQGTGDNAYWLRRRDQKRAHLARLILIGLYTGTRPGAILSLQWIRNTTGGWADLDRGVIFRRAEGERVAHNKRKPPVKIARRLMAHLKRWRRLDGWSDEKVGLRYIVNYLGSQVTKPNKAFRSAIAAAQLPTTVTPHVLRHTRGTWLAQANVPPNEAAASLGLTAEEYERTYLHNDPDFQKSAADAY